MKVYLVGGAVRDRLLGLPVTDRDWVVVGASVDDMLDAGYQPVGRDFPVFLHPQTKEEYALARTERKTAKGYHGFSFHASPDVTLEQDLARRDLTCNAVAEDNNGNLIDPFNGEADINSRTLRHVSSAFAEDPVRILRAARLLARFTDQQFVLAESTLALMQSMVQAGEADALVAERVWQETDKALETRHPRVFFEALRECGALAVVFPELDKLFGVPQPPKWHPEIDTGLHTMMVLDQVASMTSDKATRFAAVCHDLGKGETDPALWPSHHGHEAVGAKLSKALCSRLRVPGEYRDLAVLVARFHTHVHKVHELKASTLAKTLASLDVLRKPERFKQFLIACEADARGRTGFEQQAYPQAAYLQQAADVYTQVDAAALARTASRPEAIGETIHNARISAIKSFLAEQKPSRH